MSDMIKKWKEKLPNFYGNLHEKWNKMKEEAKLKTPLYSSLVASTIFPVIIASQQGDASALLGMGAALGNVFSGIGQNLLANMIQKKQDEKENAQEIDIAIHTEGEDAIEYKKFFDTLLEKLDAFDIIRQTLPKSDQEWFQTTLKKEMQKLGNLERFQVYLTGSGAVAIGANSKAGGKGAVIADKIENTQINTGDGGRNIQTQIYNENKDN